MNVAVQLQRRAESNEHAFSVLAPEGRQVEGGISRPNLATRMPSANAIGEMLHFALQRDMVGGVMMNWLPGILHCDMRLTPAGGVFPPGSNRRGMLSCPLVSSRENLVQAVFSQSHPQVHQPGIVERRNRPPFAQNHERSMAPPPIPSWFTYDGGSVAFGCDEAAECY